MEITESKIFNFSIIVDGQAFNFGIVAASRAEATDILRKRLHAIIDQLGEAQNSKKAQSPN